MGTARQLLPDLMAPLSKGWLPHLLRGSTPKVGLCFFRTQAATLNTENTRLFIAVINYMWRAVRG